MQITTEYTFVTYTYMVIYGCGKRNQYETKNTTLPLIFFPIKIPVTVWHMRTVPLTVLDPVTQELSVRSLIILLHSPSIINIHSSSCFPLSALIDRYTGPGNVDTSKLILKRYKTWDPELLCITFPYKLKFSTRDNKSQTVVSNKHNSFNNFFC